MFPATPRANAWRGAGSGPDLAWRRISASAGPSRQGAARRSACRRPPGRGRDLLPREKEGPAAAPRPGSAAAGERRPSGSTTATIRRRGRCLAGRRILLTTPGRNATRGRYSRTGGWSRWAQPTRPRITANEDRRRTAPRSDERGMVRRRHSCSAYQIPRLPDIGLAHRALK